MTIKTVETALKRAYQLGQIYWQQADSEYASQNKKADVTEQNFRSLVIETLASIEQEPAVEPAPVEPIEWKHDCAALLTNDVVLWIPACPHCGKPRTVPSKPAPVECERVKPFAYTSKAGLNYEKIGENHGVLPVRSCMVFGDFDHVFDQPIYLNPIIKNYSPIDAETRAMVLDLCDQVEMNEFLYSKDVRIIVAGLRRRMGRND